MALTGWDSNKKITIKPNTGKVPSTISGISLPIHLSGSDYQDIFDELTPLNVDDDFTGTDGDAPNKALWGAYLPFSGFNIQSNKLRFTTTAISDGKYRSRFKISGDFDVQLDFDLVNAPATDIWVSGFFATIDDNSGTDRITMSIRYDSGRVYRSSISSSTGASVGAQTATTTDDSGKLRVTRVGAVITSYYWNGSGWAQLQSSDNFTTADLYIMPFGLTTASMTFTCDLDNFIVNSGTVVWENASKQLALEIGDTGEQCYIEINDSLWDAANKEAIIWSRIPELSQSTELNLYYDSAHADNNTRTAAEASDDFSGTDGDAPNRELWDVVPKDNFVHGIQSNSYSLVNSAATTSEVFTLLPRLRFSGDFDISTKFTINSSTGTNDYLLFLSTDGIYFYLIRDFTRYGNNVYRFAVYNHSWAILQAETTFTYTGDLSGLRVKREGSVYTVYGWNESAAQWEWDGSTSGRTWTDTTSVDPEARPQIQIGRRASTDSGSLDVSIHDFTVNSADSIPGFVDETGTVPAQQVWTSETKFATLQGDPTGSILDSTSYGANGTSYGSMTSGDLVSGISGNLIELDGVDDHLNFAYNSAHNITDTVTFEAVIRPNQLIDSSIPDYLTLMNRTYYPSQGEDSYGLLINPATGMLQVTTQGGNIQGTNNSWAASTEYYVVFTYNSTGLTGDLFVYDLTNGTGAKELLTSDAYDTMAGCTNDLLLGAGGIGVGNFPGAIGFTRLSREVKSDDYIAVMAEALGASLFYVPVASTVPTITIPANTFNSALENFPFRVKLSSSSGADGFDASDWFIETSSSPSALYSAIDTGLSSTGWTDKHMRQVIPASLLSASTDRITVTLKSTGIEWTCSAIWIGHASGSGDAYDFSGDQVEVLFSGASGCTVPTTGDLTSDEITYSLDHTKNLVVSFVVTTNYAPYVSGGVTDGSEVYMKQSQTASDAGVTDVTGFTGGNVFCGLLSVDGYAKTKVWRRLKFTQGGTNLYAEMIPSTALYQDIWLKIDVPDPTIDTVIDVDYTSSNTERFNPVLTDVSDDFEGASLKNQLWGIDQTNGLIEIVNGKLRNAITSAAGALWTDSRYKLSGDFDIQVDFDLASVTNTNVWLADLRVYNVHHSASDEGVQVGRRYTASANSYKSEVYSGGVLQDSDTVATSDTSGKLRIVRSGTTATAYYWNGAGWTAMSTYTSFGDDDLYVHLIVYTSTSQSVTIDFDNFVVNSVDKIVNTYDDFIGPDNAAPKDWLWEPIVSSDNFHVKSNQLALDTTTTDDGIVRSKYKLSGDFDVQVDFDLTTAPVTDIWAMSLFATVNDNASGDSGYVDIRYNGGRQYKSSFKSSTASPSFSIQTASTSDSSGKLKLVRTGDVATSHYWNGASWTQLDSFSGFTTEDVYILLRGVTTSTMTFEGAFDNLVINSADSIAYTSDSRTPAGASDDFTGTDGDSPNGELWRERLVYVVPTIQSNQLELYVAASSEDDQGIESIPKISGNFDLQIDFITPDINTNSWGVNLRVEQDSNNYVYLSRRYDSGDIYRTVEVIDGAAAEVSAISTTDLTGKLRIVRSDSTITTYSYNGVSWDLLGTVSNGFTGAIVVAISLTTWSTLPEVTAQVDNFTINSADHISGFMGEIGTIPAQQVWDSNSAFVTHQGDPTERVLDSTLHAAHGTSSGSMTSDDLVDGVSGQLIELDGTDDYINHGYNAAHDITDTLTLEAVIKPDQLLNSASLTTATGVVSRQHSTDSFALFLNTDGKLQLGTSGGNTQSTTSSFSADTEYYLAATYNSTGLVGDLFIYNLTSSTGGKETLSNDSLDSMAGGVDNLYIGLHSSGYFPGGIGFVRISNTVRTDDYIDAVYKTLGADLYVLAEGASPPATVSITNFLIQGYDLEALIVQNFVTQLYDLTSLVVNYIEQVYGLPLLASLIQKYDDQEILKAKLDQWYKSNPKVRKTLHQLYESAKQVEAVLVAKYSLTVPAARQLVQEYVIAGIQHKKMLTSQYDIKDVFELSTLLKQNYNIIPDDRFLTVPSTSCTIAGTAMKFSGIDIEFSQDQYAGSCTLNLVDFSDWEKINYLDQVVVTHNLDTYRFVMISKTKTEDFKSLTLNVEAMSPAVLLDFPYASQIEDNDLVTGDLSSIVNNVAALEGLTVVWDIPVDSPITERELQTEGNSPLTAIKSVANALGGIIQSDADGAIHAEPRYKVDSDKYDTATATVFTSGESFLSLQEETEKRDGFNKYSVTDSATDDGYTLETEEITAGQFKVKAYRVPWSSEQKILTTSELANVIIVASSSPVFEEIEDEDLQIVNGAGSLSKPFYGLVEVDYGTRTDLGALEIKEDGTFTTATMGNTLVNVKYTTKYWAWDTYNTDKEQVQFILESVE